MGGKQSRAGKHLCYCITAVIFFSLAGCATLKEIKTRRDVRQKLLHGRELLAAGDYQGALRENEGVLTVVGQSSPGDRALFNLGLIFAHPGNPDRDYKKAVQFFKKMVQEFPCSSLGEDARVWVAVLDDLEAKAQKDRSLDRINGDKQSRTLRAHNYILRGQELLVREDYQGALEKNEKALSLLTGRAARDEALFNRALIYASPGNPDRNYATALSYFKTLTSDYPDSPFAGQAKLWIDTLDFIQGTLDVIEKEKQVDIKVEQMKKELSGEVVEGRGGENEVGPPELGGELPATAGNLEGDNLIQDGVIDREKDGRKSTIEDEGGNLYFLALKNYARASETLFDLVVRANPSITDIRKIDDHQEILIPVITAESYIEELTGGDYRVFLGAFDTSSMATAWSKKAGQPGKQFYIEPHRFSSRDTWYRLTMGDFTSREEALKAVRFLIEQGLIYIPPRRR